MASNGEDEIPPERSLLNKPPVNAIVEVSEEPQDASTTLGVKPTLWQKANKPGSWKASAF